LDHFVSISAGLVPVPELCPGASAAERSQETLYLNLSSNENILKEILFAYPAIISVNSFLTFLEIHSELFF
jgi:hypothetical protein